MHVNIRVNPTPKNPQCPKYLRHNPCVISSNPCSVATSVNFTEKCSCLLKNCFRTLKLNLQVLNSGEYGSRAVQTPVISLPAPAVVVIYR